MMMMMMQSVIFKLLLVCVQPSCWTRRLLRAQTWPRRWPRTRRRRRRRNVRGVRREERVVQPCTDWTPGNNYILSLCPPVTESELSRHIYIVNGKTDPTVSELHKYYQRISCFRGSYVIIYISTTFT